MTYDLAKELQDGGFPQIPCEFYYFTDPEKQNRAGTPFHVSRIHPDDLGHVIAAPTLSELIVACETQHSGFLFLQREKDFWVARGWKLTPDDWIELAGLTPEEAATHLWLALNAK